MEMIGTFTLLILMLVGGVVAGIYITPQVGLCVVMLFPLVAVFNKRRNDVILQIHCKDKYNF